MDRKGIGPSAVGEFECADDISLCRRERKKGGANTIVAVASDDACERKQAENSEEEQKSGVKQKSREPEPSLTPKGPVTLQDDDVPFKNG